MALAAVALGDMLNPNNFLDQLCGSNHLIRSLVGVISEINLVHDVKSHQTVQFRSSSF